MCFKRKDGSRLLLSRSYRYKSGNYFVHLKKDDKSDRLLIIEFNNNGGETSFTFANMNDNTQEVLDNPSSGRYELKVIKGAPYKLYIKSKGAIGSYVISIINL